MTHAPHSSQTREQFDFERKVQLAYSPERNVAMILPTKRNVKEVGIKLPII